ncbi:unnamed protein product [Bursaphelenchus okinawaensis]|uniref:FTH domain-containing protein n=1 Tax=Bursaphelenchus okinawaensis TaxID=465554 RepID=A0A811LLI5_9BILA|nr:unnamed protein product [Bursaphelenchus okinawaensis]CAG9127783.1 unnamed protein product [Bursaphelenchus okinawaensis]
MGCNLSSQNKPKVVRETAGHEDDSTEVEESIEQDHVSASHESSDDTVNVEEELSTTNSISDDNGTTSSELDTERTHTEQKESDYLDSTDISNAYQIDIELHSNSTELDLVVSERLTYETIIEINGEFDVIIDKLTQCLKKERLFFVHVYLYDQCVWSPVLLNVIADFLLHTLPSIRFRIKIGSTGNVYVPFVDFYRKIHPIVNFLYVDKPTLLKFIMDMRIEILVLEPTSDLCWLPLKYTQVNQLQFNKLSILEYLRKEDILLPSVKFVNFELYNTVNVDLDWIFQTVSIVFSSKHRLRFDIKVTVEEMNEPIMDHELFFQIANVFKIYNGILNQKQRSVIVAVLLRLTYKGPINMDLARKMSEYVGYECCYKDGNVRFYTDQSDNKPKTVRETADGGQEDDSTEIEESIEQDNVSASAGNSDDSTRTEESIEQDSVSTSTQSSNDSTRTEASTEQNKVSSSTESSDESTRTKESIGQDYVSASAESSDDSANVEEELSTVNSISHDSTRTEESIEQDTVSTSTVSSDDSPNVEEELSTTNSSSDDNGTTSSELDTESSNTEEDESDYIDGVDISNVYKINLFLKGDSTELIVKGSIVGCQISTIIFCDEYDVIMEKLKLCLKKERRFVLQSYLNNECVWSPSLLNILGDLFLNTLPPIVELFIFGDPRNINVPFIDFYRKLHPIVTCLTIDNPTILRFFFDMEFKALTPRNPNLDFNWLPSKYTQVVDLVFNDSSMLQVLRQQDIVMPQVLFVIFRNHDFEVANTKLVLEEVCSLFPSIKCIKLQFVVHVQEKNEPIMNHRLFTITRTVFHTFESMLDWNQGKIKLLSNFYVYYNGPVNDDLARKITDYIGYECCYDKDKVRLEIHQSNVCLEMRVEHE